MHKANDPIAFYMRPYDKNIWIGLYSR